MSSLFCKILPETCKVVPLAGCRMTDGLHSGMKADSARRYNSRRPSRARMRVASSVNSKCPPTGMP